MIRSGFLARVQQGWYRLVRFVCRWTAVTLWGLRGYGMRHVPRTGGVILAVNHQSFLDPALVALPLERPTHPMARATLFRNPAFGALIVTLNAFPIERDSRDVKGVKEALSRLKAGRALLVFPEGTRTRDGTVGLMKAGIRLLAERAAAPIVPVLIEGAYEAWPKGRLFPGFRRINVIFGPPVALDAGAEGAEQLRDAVVRLGTVPHRKIVRRTNVESKTG